VIIARPAVILHVEDEDLFHDYVVEGLEEAGVEADVHRARDGAEAIRLIGDSSIPLPDLILLDLYMHPRDGFWFLEKLRSMNDIASQLKVVVLTTSDDDIDRFRARELGVHVQHFVKKPVKFLDLVSLLESFGHCIARTISKKSRQKLIDDSVDAVSASLDGRGNE